MLGFAARRIPAVRAPRRDPSAGALDVSALPLFEPLAEGVRGGS